MEAAEDAQSTFTRSMMLAVRANIDFESSTPQLVYKMQAFSPTKRDKRKPNNRSRNNRDQAQPSEPLRLTPPRVKTPPPVQAAEAPSKSSSDDQQKLTLDGLINSPMQRDGSPQKQAAQRPPQAQPQPNQNGMAPMAPLFNNPPHAGMRAQPHQPPPPPSLAQAAAMAQAARAQGGIPQPPQHIVDQWFGRKNSEPNVPPHVRAQQRQEDLQRFAQLQQMLYMNALKIKYQQQQQYMEAFQKTLEQQNPAVQEQQRKAAEKYRHKVQAERVPAPEDWIRSERFPTNAEIRALGREYMKNGKNRKAHTPFANSTLGHFYREHPF